METNKYGVDPETTIAETDLDQAPITLPDGTVLDEAAAEQFGREVADRQAGLRGRPSLSGPGVSSPQISTRVSAEVRDALDAIARRDGVKPAEVLRRALEKYVHEHSG